LEAKSIVYLFPDTLLTQRSEVAINRSPRRKVCGQSTPLTACFENVSDGIENGFPFPFPFQAVFVTSFEEKGLDELALPFVKMTWVGFHCSKQNLPAFVFLSLMKIVSGAISNRL